MRDTMRHMICRTFDTHAPHALRCAANTHRKIEFVFKIWQPNTINRFVNTTACSHHSSIFELFLSILLVVCEMCQFQCELWSMRTQSFVTKSIEIYDDRAHCALAHSQSLHWQHRTYSHIVGNILKNWKITHSLLKNISAGICEIIRLCVPQCIAYCSTHCAVLCCAYDYSIPSKCAQRLSIVASLANKNQT